MAVQGGPGMPGRPSTHPRSGGRARVVRLVVPLLVVALVAGSCTRADDDLEVGAVAAGGGAATSAPGGREGGGAGTFGDLEDVCGPGDAEGETAQGVTDDSIRVATFSDPGFVGRPGLNQELFDAGEVFTSWCNEAGGINGREIEVDQRDAKLTEYKQRVTESCAEDFMMVGGGGVFDDTGQEERLRCLLPVIPGYLVSPQARGADLAVPPLPNALDEVSIGVYQYLDEKFPDSTGDVGFLTGNVPATIVIDRQNQEGVRSLGWDVTYRAQYNAVGEASWTPFAQALRTRGVKGLVYTGEPENMAKLLQAVADIDYALDWVVVGANHLDQRFVDLGGAALKDVYMASAVVPFFQADDNPATQLYLDLFEEYLPDGKSQALLGVNSFSAWLLFATAVKECGSEVTRSCVFEAAQGVTEWSGGGLHAVTDPSEGKAPKCGVLVEATPDGFVVPDDADPNEGLFRCSDDSVYELKGDYGTGTKLADVGKSIDDLE